jgi:hypothetical protein
MKHTPQSHPDYGSFGEALTQIEKITEQVNEGKRIAENMQRIVEIHNSFTDKEVCPLLPFLTLIIPSFCVFSCST